MGSKCRCCCKNANWAGVAGDHFILSQMASVYSHSELKVVYPGFQGQFLQGLLIESINDPNPVMFFEHKALYRSCSEMVSE